MSISCLFTERSEPQFRWPLQMLFALLAPALALCIHSFYVMLWDYRLYNSELWVLVGVDDRFNSWRFGVVAEALIQAVWTFIVLWFVVKHPVWYRIVWIGCIALFILFAFMGDQTVK